MKRTEEERIKEFRKLMEKYCTEEFVLYLYRNGYFKAPASSMYHGNEEGGLFEHSHLVALILRQITDTLGIRWERTQSPEVIGLNHDICKMDEYIKVPDMVKTIYADNKVSERYKSDAYHYEKNTKALLSGHGDKSVILALSKMYLTDEEIMCIRYHMGAFAGKEEWKNYTEAVSRYPNILWVNYADMLASQYFKI